ncbi:hypothetical protein RUM43_012191 [Polyplax serrata]|uniref:Uncharacterized protein n=1 Tax=Polyplax serrata TaxID=468196 RepID=A0AAN8NRU6_POLSC
MDVTSQLEKPRKSKVGAQVLFGVDVEVPEVAAAAADVEVSGADSAAVAGADSEVVEEDQAGPAGADSEEVSVDVVTEEDVSVMAVTGKGADRSDSVTLTAKTAPKNSKHRKTNDDQKRMRSCQGNKEKEGDLLRSENRGQAIVFGRQDRKGFRHDSGQVN